MEISTVRTLIAAPKDGTKGADAVMYYMTPDKAFISADADGVSSDDPFFVFGYKIVGASSPVAVSNRYKAYYENGGRTVGYKTGLLPLEITPDEYGVIEYIYIDMYDDQELNVVATCDIPVVKNGRDGKKGEDGISFQIKGNAVGYFQTLPSAASAIQGRIYLRHPCDKCTTNGNTWSIAIAPENEAYITDDDKHVWVSSQGLWRDLGPFQGPKGDPGERGPRGEKGDDGLAGPMTYMAGEWKSDITYTRDYSECPIVLHNGSYWYLRSIGSNIGGEPSASSTVWKILEQMEIVFARILMAEFGKIAAAIFSGTHMLSQYGVNHGVEINESSPEKETAYTNFDHTDPTNGDRFVPNLFIDFLTGRFHSKIADIEGRINAKEGLIGGFEIGNGHIGVVSAKNDPNAGNLSIYKDFLRVGGFNAYAKFGDDVVPETLGGAFTAAGRIVNKKINQTYGYFDPANYGLMISVTGGKKNFGIASDAPLRAPAVYGDECGRLYINSSSYEIDMSQHNVFYIYCTTDGHIRLPSKSSIERQFCYNTLPQYFAYKVTFIAEAGTSRFYLDGVVGGDNQTFNHAMAAGDVVELLVSAYPNFHYKMLNYIN